MASLGQQRVSFCSSFKSFGAKTDPRWFLPLARCGFTNYFEQTLLGVETKMFEIRTKSLKQCQLPPLL